jgi:hypothetical protein
MAASSNFCYRYSGGRAGLVQNNLFPGYGTAREANLFVSGGAGFNLFVRGGACKNPFVDARVLV